VHSSAVFTDADQGAGVLVHEIGHALLDHGGVLERIYSLPDGVGPLANEVIAESLASAVAREAGFTRTSSSIAREDGSLRSPAHGFDDIMRSEFYVDYYSIDLANYTPAERQQTYDAITNESINLIESLGGTPPPEYTEDSTQVLKHVGGWLNFDIVWSWQGEPETVPVPAPQAPTPSAIDKLKDALEDVTKHRGDAKPENAVRAAAQRAALRPHGLPTTVSVMVAS
jgi:hypothetical protein